MGFADKLKKVFVIDKDYLDDEDDDGIEEIESPRERILSREPVLTREKPLSNEPVMKTDRKNSVRATADPSTRVVDIHTTAKLQVVLKKPVSFDEATVIADELREKRTVVLNLEATEKGEAGKLLCFLSGVAYANDGKMKKIANNTYIITPYNVDVMGDLLDELESNGMFFYK